MASNFKVYYLIIYFFCLNNFYWTNLLTISHGVGIGLLRAKLFMLFVALSVIPITLNINFRNKFPKNIFNLFLLFCFIFVLRIFIDFLQFDNNIDLIGTLPLIEFIFIIIYVNLVGFNNFVLTRKFSNFIVFFVFLNISLEIIYYLIDLMNGISYGPFRAYISSITINRNPSFFYPIFGLIILLFYKQNKLIKVIFSMIFIVYIMTLFYRTLYVALLFPLVFHFFKSKFIKKINLNFIFKTSIFLFIFLLVIYYVELYIYNYTNFSLSNLFIDRFKSTSLNLSNDAAQNQRVGQIPILLKEILLNPLGGGFNHEILGNRVYNYGYFMLHPIIYLGWIAIPFYYKIIVIILKTILNFNKNLNYTIFTYILLYLLTIFIFFPYMTYFNFASMFILIIYLSNLKINKNYNILSK
jgi:hypothetical protein